MTKILFFLGVFLNLTFGMIQAAEKPEDIIKAYDISSYHPQLFGLKDLAVDVRVSELLKQLNDKLIFGKIEDVYFRIYWLSSGKADIEVYGLPKGFNEVKAELRSLIFNRLDFIIPKFLEPDLKGYKLTLGESLGSSQMIKVQDPEHVKFIHEMDFEIDSQYRLTKMTAMSPVGQEKASFTYSKKGWGQNKWVIDEVEITSTQGIQSTVVKNKLAYEKFSGFGFPVRIESKTMQVLLQPTSGKNEVYKREIDNVITFSNYKVNAGEAKSYFQKKK